MAVLQSHPALNLLVQLEGLGLSEKAIKIIKNVLHAAIHLNWLSMVREFGFSCSVIDISCREIQIYQKLWLKWLIALRCLFIICYLLSASLIICLVEKLG